jgi:2'-5' RNA ligase
MRIRFGAILGSLFRMADDLGSGALLSAAKADDLKANYPELASGIDLLAESDPTPQKKYLDWSVKMLRTGVDVMEVIETVKNYHEVFDRLRGSDRDVSSFRSLRDMKDATGNVEQKVSKSEAKKKSKKGADILYEDDRWQLVHPTTMDGAIYYGHNTSWCVSRRDKKENYFYSPYMMSYNVQFYFLIDKKSDIYDEAAASTGGHHFSKLAMLFSDGVLYQKEKFQDAANRKPTEAEVRTAIGSDFDKLYDIAWEHAKKHKETPLYKLANAKNKGDFYSLYEESKEYVDPEKLGEGPGVLLTVFNLAMKVGADDVVFDILSKNYEKDRDYESFDLIESVGSYIDDQMVSTPSANFIAKVFELVAKHDSPVKKEFELLKNIVKSPISPIQVIRKIAKKYGDYRIVDAIRESKTASADAEVMSGLANSFDEDARKLAAENENTPIEDLKKLVKDKDVNVALGLASNKSIFKDGDLLRSVISKKNDAQSLYIPWNMRKTFVTDLISTVLSNGACPDDLFSELMDELLSKEPERRRVERYVYSILDALSSDNVKDGLNTSKLLTILTKVTDGWVDLDLDSLSMRLVSNDSTEPAVVEELYKAIAASLHPSEPSYKKEDALRALGNLAGSPRTPPSVLAKAWKHAPSASDLGIDIDGQLARNPSTPAEIREAIEAIAEKGEGMSAKLDAAIERLHAMSAPVNVLLAMEEAAELLSAGNVGGVDRNNAMVVMIPLPKHLAMRFPGVEHNNGHEPHLTVCFLTASEEMTMGKASEALAIIRRICRRQAPFRIALDVNSGLQDFGQSPKGSKALWFDVRQDPNDVLDKLHRAIKNALKLEGLPVEHQNTFQPHVTWRYVANDQSEGERQRMSAFAASRFNDLVSLWFDVKHIIVTMPDRSQRAVALSPRLR